MLKNYVKIYVPSITKDGEPVKRREEVLSLLLDAFSRNFGGCTAIDGKGAWIGANNKLVVEDVTVVTAFHDCVPETANHFVKVYAKGLQEVCKQECVTVECDGVLEFIAADTVIA